MANEEHLKILKQGVEAWNEWREKNPGVRPDLSEADLIKADLIGARLFGADLFGADLSEANLSEADLIGARLFEADLFGADLSRADLSEANLGRADLGRADLGRARLFSANLGGADLSEANLSEVDLFEADLSGAKLGEADLSGSNLGGVNLSMAYLSGANLDGAILYGTIFADVDLSRAKGLDEVIHRAPSTIGIDTIYASQGQIPEVFLKGAGVDDTFISYIQTFTQQPIQYYSCFISYSHQDEEFANRLHADLQQNNVRCWFAPEDIQSGKKMYPQIDEAIRVHDKLLLVLSDHSLNSEWVMTEIRRARLGELRDNRQKLFPIRLVDMLRIKEWTCFDADTGKDLAVEVREYHIGDFSNWKDHDAYHKAFERLLRDLKVGEA